MGITVEDLRKAILGGGDAGAFTPVLHQALGKPPIPSVASLERPLALPETGALLKDMDRDLETLLSCWQSSREFQGQHPEKPDVMLVEVAPYGRNIGSYLERIIAETAPDVLALDVSPLSFAASMLYAMSLPSACGLPWYGEIRAEGGEKPMSRDIFYPGGMNETTIIKGWLGKIPLLPVGMPRAPESASLAADEDHADEEMSGLRLRTAYSAFNEALEKTPVLKAAMEAGEKIGYSLENTLSIGMTRKLQREAHYSASRVLDILSFLRPRVRKARLLAIVDIKHSLEIRRALSNLLQNPTDDVYLPPRNYALPALVMAGQHSPELNDYTREYLPQTSLTQGIFQKAMDAASLVMEQETLTEEMTDSYISQVVQRTRHHPLIARGVSPRGSIAFKELASSLSQLKPGPSRDSLEKVALIVLPSRITLRPGIKDSRTGIVSTIVKEVLYDISFTRVIYQLVIGGDAPWMSMEDIGEALEDLSEKIDEKLPARSEITVVPTKSTDSNLLKALEAKNLLKQGQQGGYFLTRKAIEHLMQSLSQKLTDGKIARERYELEKARLEAMLPAGGDKEYQLSRKELAETIMDFMDAVDKQVDKEWGKDINFLRMHSYYYMRAEKSDKKTGPPNKDFLYLKFLIDDLVKRGILKTSLKWEERTLSGAALSLLVGYLGIRDPSLRRLRESLNGRKVQIAQRSQGVRHFSTGSVFRDISFRHTLKEIARQRKDVCEARRGDFRVHLTHRHKENRDFVLCVDTSGSMSEQRKIIYARLAAGVIADEATANGDRIGLVAFDDLGQTTLPLDSQNIEVINNYLVGLSGMGATNIGDGIRCAADLLQSASSHNKKHIILITDGEPNAITDKAFAQLKEKSEGDPTKESALMETRRASAQGITVSVVYLTDGKMAGSEFVRGIARAGRGKVITITCHDE